MNVNRVLGELNERGKFSVEYPDNGVSTDALFSAAKEIHWWVLVTLDSMIRRGLIQPNPKLDVVEDCPCYDCDSNVCMVLKESSFSEYMSALANEVVKSTGREGSDGDKYTGMKVEWTTKEGTLPKRIAKAWKNRIKIITDSCGAGVYEDCKEDFTLFMGAIKNIPPPVMGRVGDVLTKGMIKRKDHLLRISDQLDWKPGKYGDEGSCYWGERSNARLALISYEAYALKFYDPNSPSDGLARCWLVPTPKDNPTMVCLFNAYSKRNHNYTLTTMARILSHIMGDAFYKRVYLENCGSTTGMMWINTDTGFLIGDQDMVSPLTKWDLHIDVDDERDDSNHFECYECGQRTHIDDAYVHGDYYFCQSCYDEHFSPCDHCGDSCRRENLIYIESSDEYVCEGCFDSDYGTCDHCGEGFRDTVLECVGDGTQYYCKDCRDKISEECSGSCGGTYLKDDMIRVRDELGVVKYYCKDCVPDTDDGGRPIIPSVEYQDSRQTSMELVEA